MNNGRVKCPTCKRDLDWRNAPFRPFCSERCRLVDLGAWFSGRRSIPGDDAPTQDGGGSDAPPGRDNT